MSLLQTINKLSEELSRLDFAKNAIRTAIIAHGIEVPAEARIETFPAYIAKISSGDSDSGGSDNVPSITISGADIAAANQTYMLKSGDVDNPGMSGAIFEGATNSTYSIRVWYDPAGPMGQVEIRDATLPEGMLAYFTITTAGPSVENILAAGSTWTTGDGISIPITAKFFAAGGSSTGGGTADYDTIIVSGAGSAAANDTYRRVTEGGAADWGQQSNIYYAGQTNGVTLQFIYEPSFNNYSATIGISPPYYNNATPILTPEDVPTATWSTVAGAEPLPTVTFGSK